MAGEIGGGEGRHRLGEAKSTASVPKECGAGQDRQRICPAVSCGVAT